MARLLVRHSRRVCALTTDGMTHEDVVLLPWSATAAAVLLLVKFCVLSLCVVVRKSASLASVCVGTRVAGPPIVQFNSVSDGAGR